VANNVIYNNGTNVGIGVGSSIDPSYKLTIGYTGVKITNTGSTYTLYAEDEASDTTPFVIDTAGNVGIGTTSPSYKLDVNGIIATPYWKSPIAGDITKDGIVNSYDLTLAYSVFGCYKNADVGCGDANSNGICDCWENVIGADTLSNYLYGRDADVTGDNKVDLADMLAIANNFADMLTPYIFKSDKPKNGDINKNGIINSEDLLFLLQSFNCSKGMPCWSDIVGADNVGNPIYKGNCDLNGDNKVDLSDYFRLASNYEPYVYIISTSYPSLGIKSAAEFRGDAVVTDAGYLQIQKTSAGAPPSGDCSDSYLGRFTIDTTNKRLYICMGTAGWKYVQLQP
jgi:hypothetical protein